jgi:hypothetical protein
MSNRAVSLRNLAARSSVLLPVTEVIRAPADFWYSNVERPRLLVIKLDLARTHATFPDRQPDGSGNSCDPDSRSSPNKLRFQAQSTALIREVFETVRARWTAACEPLSKAAARRVLNAAVRVRFSGPIV